jgi:hypothetical protein
MSKKINLEEIYEIYRDRFIKNLENHPDYILSAMKEACKQALKLAAENAITEEIEVAESISGGDGYTYFKVDTESITNTINQIE